VVLGVCYTIAPTTTAAAAAAAAAAGFSLMLLLWQSAREALKAKLKSDPSFRKELRKRVTDSLLAKSDEDPKTAQYNFDAYMLTGAAAAAVACCLV
jgi:hypothetical protein